MVGVSPTLAIYFCSDSLSSERFGLLSRRNKMPSGVRVPLGAPIYFYPSQVLRKHAPFGAVWTQFNSAVVDHFVFGVVA